MTLRAGISDVLSRHGAKYTLRRELVSAGTNAWTKGIATVSYGKVQAREIQFSPEEIRGGLAERAVKLTIDAVSASAAPKEGDRIALGEFTSDAGAEWRHVSNVYAVRVRGYVVLYRLIARA